MKRKNPLYTRVEKVPTPGCRRHLHPDGEGTYTRMEKVPTPGWRKVIHPGGERLFELSFKWKRA